MNRKLPAVNNEPEISGSTPIEAIDSLRPQMGSWREGNPMAAAEWYFRMGDEVSGPFDLDTMRGFRRSGLLKAESMVSLLSIPGQWISAGETEIFREPNPPPLSAPSTARAPSDPVPTDDRFAWSLACAALAIPAFEGLAFRIGIAPFYEDWYASWGWLFYLFVCGLLANADIARNRSILTERQVPLILIVPAYFWVRRRQSRTTSTMLAVNLLAVALGLAVTFGKIPVLGGTNIRSCHSTTVGDLVRKLIQQTPAMSVSKIEVLRSIHELSYDGRSRVCSGEIVTDSNLSHRIEFSTEVGKKTDEEYVRVRFVN